jgi:3-dehydroquinate synthetase
MSLLKKILTKSKKIDWSHKKIKDEINFKFPVAKTHQRRKTLKHYIVEVKSFNKLKLNPSDLILVDKAILPSLNIKEGVYKNLLPLVATEGYTKTLNFAEKIQIKYFNKKIKRVVGIGGGVVLDLSSYLAEQMKSELILVPTTIIAMCDASTGGKVRMNFVDAGRYIKHHHKSFYEPNRIIVDFNFLKTLNAKQIGTGLAETIKHGFAQSPKLVKYLASKEFNPMHNFEDLKRAILWTIDLKRICLTVDPEESTKGSHKIIYLGHIFANQIEEESLFKTPHGVAVEKGLVKEFLNKPKQAKTLEGIYKKLGIV